MFVVVPVVVVVLVAPSSMHHEINVFNKTALRTKPHLLLLFRVPGPSTSTAVLPYRETQMLRNTALQNMRIRYARLQSPACGFSSCNGYTVSSHWVEQNAPNHNSVPGRPQHSQHSLHRQCSSHQIHQRPCQYEYLPRVKAKPGMRAM